MAIIDTTMDVKSYRIAHSLVGLATSYFYALGVALPTTATYKNFSEQLGQSDGGAVQHGYRFAELTWVNVDPYTAFKIKEFVDFSLGSTKVLYMTVPYNDGSYIARRFIDISGRPIPLDIAEAGVVQGIGGSGIFFDNLVLRLSNITIENNPAVF